MWKLNEVHENLVLSKWGELLRRHPTQIGALHETDAELVPLDDDRVLALTIDAVSEEVAAGLYQDPRTVGRVAILASVSDLAAVGADPVGLLVATTIPEHGFDEIQQGLGVGIREAADRCGMFVLGGDTNEGDQLEVTVAAAGTLPREEVITRVGSSPGDRVFVSGPVGLGGALAASNLLRLGGLDEADFFPQPRLAEGQVVRRHGSACMDTSDGLIATLDQLARLNGVRFEIDVSFDSFLHVAAAQIAADSGIGAFPFAASYHGEFELVFTIAAATVDTFIQAASAIGWTPIEIGRVKDGEGLGSPEGDIDGAHIRNLLHDVGGDVGEYARRLIQRGNE